MKYGNIKNIASLNIDLTLPADHKDNKAILQKANAADEVKIYTGCAKWGRKEWEGILYPAGTKEKDYLLEYVKHFNALELNGTFYNIKKANIISWTEKAVDGFKFCPKVSRRISHIKRLKVEDDFLEYFISATLLMGDKLGMAFLQLPENFTPKYFDRLEEFLKHIPLDYKMAFEFRHEEWFNDSTVFDETFNLLKEYKKTGIITDVALHRDVLHARLTGPEIFIRFNGYGLNPHTYRRIDEWVERLKLWIEMGIKEIYFFPHQEDETFTPATCLYFIEKMNEICGTNIPVPQMSNKVV